MKRTNPPSTKLETYTKSQLMTFSSELMNRANLFARLGQQYGGDRDVYEALGYPLTLSYEDYASRYSRQDIARAIINRPVQFTWKGPVTITELGDGTEKVLEKAWAKLERRLKLKSKFVRLDKLASIGSYGVLLLGFNDVKKQDDWGNPVSAKNNKLNYVKPLGEGNAKIASYVKRSSDPRFGMVGSYDITLTNPGGESTTTFGAHYSRVLHVVPELLESEIEGAPALKSVWNRLMDLEKLVGGSAEMFWRGARPGYQAIMDPDYTMGATMEAALEGQIDEYEKNLRRMIVNQGVEFKALESQVSNPKEHVEIQIDMISSITGIPKRVLMGSERGELSSAQDATGWLNVIQTRREEHAEINIIRPFVDMCIDYGILPSPTTEDYQIVWLDLFASSDKDKAEVGRIRATALREYVSNPLAAEIMPPTAFFEYFLGLDELQQEKIKETVSEGVSFELAAIRAAQLEDVTEEVAVKPVNANGDGN